MQMVFDDHGHRDRVARADSGDRTERFLVSVRDGMLVLGCGRFMHSIRFFVFEDSRLRPLGFCCDNLLFIALAPGDECCENLFLDCDRRAHRYVGARSFRDRYGVMVWERIALFVRLVFSIES